MFSLIVSYYSAPQMLRRQLDEAKDYPDSLKVIVIDDGSPVKAQSVFEKGDRASLYRITQDVAWNRGMARNLGAYVSETPWIIQVDIDHVLPAECADRLVTHLVTPGFWYRFPRFRVGKADFTRKKDAIPENQEFGQIHPHIDSYLIEKHRYWPGYDERYAGVLGGGVPFLTDLTARMGEPHILPEDIHLNVYTSDKIKDASVKSLSRDPIHYQKRREELAGTRSTSILNYQWERVR